jgi:hypothetical protein
VRPARRHRDLLRGARRLGLSLRAEATDARTGPTTVIERRLVLTRR